MPRRSLLLFLCAAPAQADVLDLPVELSAGDVLVFLEDQMRGNPLAPWCVLALPITALGEMLRYVRRRRRQQRKLQQIQQSIAQRAHTPAPVRADLTGCQVGRYKLLRRLGEGSHADVYLGSHRTSGQKFALKIGEEQSAGELQLGRRLDHPHLVQVHGSGRCPHGAYLVLEYVEGEPLRNVLQRGPLSLEQTLHLFTQVCEGVAYAHKQGVLHGDLKPDNIMLTPYNEAKILDFGLARTVGVRTATLAGTPEYMAPEHFLGEPGLSSDIYALGVVLFEMLTGRLPFEAAECREIVSARLRGKAPAPSSHRADVPAQLDALCEDMLERSPTRRVATMEDVLQRLRSYAARQGRVAG
jgi:serine/threonine protein kinase